MKICENCGTVSNFIEGHCKACNSQKIIDLKISTEDWFKLDKSQKENRIKDCLSVSDEQYKLLQEIWKDNKTNIIPMETNSHSTTYIKNTPKCPTCGSTKVNKISTVKKATGFLAVGVFSSNLGKTMECKNCGYKW